VLPGLNVTGGELMICSTGQLDLLYDHCPAYMSTSPLLQGGN